MFTKHVHPRTCCVERLFTRCKLNMTALRKKMDSDSLDMLVFLMVDKKLWPGTRNVQEMLDLLTEEERLINWKGRNYNLKFEVYQY